MIPKLDFLHIFAKKKPKPKLDLYSLQVFFGSPNVNICKIVGSILATTSCPKILGVVGFR